MTAETWILGALNTRHTHKALGTASVQAWWQRVPGRRPVIRRDLDMNRSIEDHYADLLEMHPSLLAMGCHIWNVEATLKLVGSLAAALPDLTVVLGGPEISFDAHELMVAHPYVDYVVTGEGERPFEALLLQIEAGTRADIPRIAGLVWRGDDGAVHQNPGEWFIESLDELPSPFTTGLYGKGDGFTYYEGSRGCPFQCQYCLSSVQQGVREFSLRRVLSDIDWLMTSGFSQVRFADRNFNLKPERAIAIVEHILAHNIRRVGFHFELAAELLTDALIDRFALAPPNLFHLEIGVQSMNEQVNADVARRCDSAVLARRIRQLLERTRCHVHLDLLLGLPAEDREAFLRSVDETLALSPHTLQVGTVKLLKGTALRARAERDGISVQPFPPYQTLSTQRMTPRELSRLRDAGRLIETLYNQGRFRGFLRLLARWGFAGSPARMYEWLAECWRRRGFPLHGTNPEGWARMLAQVTADVSVEGARRRALLDVLAHEQRLAAKVPAGPLGPAPAAEAPLPAKPPYRLASGVRVFWATTDIAPLLDDAANAEPGPTPMPVVYRFETDLSRPPKTEWLRVSAAEALIVGHLALGWSVEEVTAVMNKYDVNTDVPAAVERLERLELLTAATARHKGRRVHEPDESGG